MRPYDTARQQIAVICWTPFDEARCQIEAKNAFDRARLDMVAKYALPGRERHFTGYFDQFRIGTFNIHDLTTGVRLLFNDNLARIQISERFDVKQNGTTQLNGGADIKTRLELENKYGSEFLLVFDKRHETASEQWREEIVDMFITQATPKNVDAFRFYEIKDRLTRLISNSNKHIHTIQTNLGSAYRIRSDALCAAPPYL